MEKPRVHGGEHQQLVLPILLLPGMPSEMLGKWESHFCSLQELPGLFCSKKNLWLAPGFPTSTQKFWLVWVYLFILLFFFAQDGDDTSAGLLWATTAALHVKYL